ncbi:MAG: hypothetical protein ACRDF4_04140 [Rhabdochlamydiaceae bacterium]
MAHLSKEELDFFDFLEETVGLEKTQVAAEAAKLICEIAFRMIHVLGKHPTVMILQGTFRAIQDYKEGPPNEI